MIKYLFLLAVVAPRAFAAMPVPVLAQSSYDAAAWEALAPQLKSALECRSLLNKEDINLKKFSVYSDKSAIWEVTIPKDFFVYGHKVHAIHLKFGNNEGDEEVGYDTFLYAKQAVIQGAVSKVKPSLFVGEVFVNEDLSTKNSTVVTCAVGGGQALDYQEPSAAPAPKK